MLLDQLRHIVRERRSPNLPAGDPRGSSPRKIPYRPSYASPWADASGLVT